jgi:hypothetical protein
MKETQQAVQRAEPSALLSRRRAGSNQCSNLCRINSSWSGSKPRQQRRQRVRDDAMRLALAGAVRTARLWRCALAG